MTKSSTPRFKFIHSLPPFMVAGCGPERPTRLWYWFIQKNAERWVGAEQRWTQSLPLTLQPLSRGMVSIRLMSIFWAGWTTTVLVAKWPSFTSFFVFLLAFSFALEFALHLLAATSDPGACPRQDVTRGGDVIQVDPAGHRSIVQSAPIDLAEETGGSADNSTATVKSRWPLRSRSDPSRRSPWHIPRFNRYCPWIGNAVGARNEWLYTLLWILRAVNAIFQLLFPLGAWGMAEVSSSWAQALWWLVLLQGVGEVTFVAEFLIWHGWLLSQNLTLEEWEHRGDTIYLKDARGNFFNPFDRQSVWLNVREALGFPPSTQPNWLYAHVFTLFELPSHPLQEPMVRKLQSLRKRARSGQGQMTTEQALALRLAEACGALPAGETDGAAIPCGGASRPKQIRGRASHGEASSLGIGTPESGNSPAAWRDTLTSHMISIGSVPDHSEENPKNP